MLSQTKALWLGKLSLLRRQLSNYLILQMPFGDIMSCPTPEVYQTISSNLFLLNLPRVLTFLQRVSANFLSVLFLSIFLFAATTVCNFLPPHYLPNYSLYIRKWLICVHFWVKSNTLLIYLIVVIIFSYLSVSLNTLLSAHNDCCVTFFQIYTT